MKLISRQDFDRHNAQQLREQHYQWIDSDSTLNRLNVSACVNTPIGMRDVLVIAFTK